MDGRTLDHDVYRNVQMRCTVLYRVKNVSGELCQRSSSTHGWRSDSVVSRMNEVRLLDVEPG